MVLKFIGGEMETYCWEWEGICKKYYFCQATPKNFPLKTYRGLAKLIDWIRNRAKERLEISFQKSFKERFKFSFQNFARKVLQTC